MRSECLAVFALLAAPSGAGAAEMPAAPPAGASFEERLYLASDTADDLALLVARVDCVAYQRALIDARLETGLLSQGWSAEADRLWRLSEALAAFEAAHIRPVVDVETEAAILAAYAAGPEADDADEAHAARCGSFDDAFVLRLATG